MSIESHKPFLDFLWPAEVLFTNKVHSEAILLKLS